MTGYGQSSYSTPYAGSSPLGPIEANTLSDAFQNTRPAWVDTLGAGEVVPGYAGLPAKWLRWDPGAAAEFLGRVNTRTQRAEYEATGKSVSGYYQQLPVPTVLGQTVELQICANVAAAVWRPNATTIFAPNIAGLLLAEDLTADPTTAAVRVLGQGGQLTPFDAGGGVEGTLQSIGPALYDFIAFDALPVGVGVSFSFLPYLRYRLRQTLTAPGAYTIDCAADTSFDGSDWMVLHIYPQAVAAARPFRSAGFAVMGGADATVRIGLGQYVVVSQAFDDLTTAIGAVQQLGSV